jgi:type I restriction enzyme S subunit
VGVIPEDWDAREIRDDIDLLTGFSFPSSGYSSSGIRLLRGSNVKRGETDWADHITQYWPSITQDIARYGLRASDLVIAMDGSLVGRSSAQLAAEDLPALLLQRVARIRSTANLDVSYLAAFVRSDWFIKHADSVKTVTAIPHISPADIRSFVIPIPPTIPEQRAIATALSDVDALLGGLDRLIAKKQGLKVAAMQQLLTGQTRLPGFSGEWEVKRLGDVGVFLKGSGVKKDESQSGPLPCIRYGEIYTRHNDYIKEFHSFISVEVAATARLLKKGDLLFAGSGETKAEIGKCVAFVDGFEAYAGGDIVILRPVAVDSLYLGFSLNTPSVNQQKTSRGQGDAVVHIGSSALADIIVNLPSVPEQTAIAAILSDMDTELAALQARRSKTQALKQAMMQELLTGRIRLV